ncbi:MAG: (Fe-S)-binding protein [Nitrososphaerota archaeon]|nr:(Fe-S)-binding protein [Nitrososphaerota archaeon]
MLLAAAYPVVYAVSLGSVLATVLALAVSARKEKIAVGAGRLLLLTKDEAKRLATGDPVFMMHLSIALGVGLSIVIAVLDPVLGIVPLLRLLLLLLSLPLIVGLGAAFAWRVQRLAQSKRVEKDILHSSVEFSRASTAVQLVLMFAIALTAAELVLAWYPQLAIVHAGLNVARNALLIVYYVKPSLNLLAGFDRPLPSMRTPFKLSDILEGRVDASEVRVGAKKLSEFASFERMSYNSCVEIGACESACPATAAGRPLSPRVLVRKLSLLEGGEGQDVQPLATVGEDELWSCTSCGACVNACPVAVKHVDIVYDLRRELTGEGKLDREKSTLLQNLSRNQNPFGLDGRSRGEWAKDNGIDTLSTNPNAEYLYWVGCVASFDQRAQRVAKSLAAILKSAGVSFAILGSEELCTGDPARRLGEEARYQELAAQNIERMNSYGVRKVITSCPHCFNTIRNEYPQFGGSYQVVHHTQLISDLVREGRLRLSPDKVGQVSVTLHDACYAARYNNIFEEPRSALRTAGTELHEMKRKGEKTFCCGAGGSNYWYKVPQQKSIAGIRTEEAAGTGARRIATECPFCMSMFEDSTRASGVQMDVRDVAEIVAEGLVESRPTDVRAP